MKLDTEHRELLYILICSYKFDLQKHSSGKTLQFEWDEEKEDANEAKHGIGFAEAAAVFDDPDAVSLRDDRYDYGEERWITIGRVALTILYVAHNAFEDDDGEEIIRIISARKATPREARIYLSR